MVHTSVLDGPRLKVERALTHMDELVRLTKPLSSDLYEIRAENRAVPPRAKPTLFEIVYTPKKPIPETLAVVIGDAIHNLRAALDHLASGIVRTRRPLAHVYFPMPKVREELHKSKDLKLIESALPGSKHLLLDKVRPEQGAEDDLWLFGKMDNDDKHNLIIPTVTIASIENLSANSENTHLHSMAFKNDAGRRFTLYASDRRIEIASRPVTYVDMTFGVSTPFDGLPVLRTLLDIARLVCMTVDSFEKLIEGRNRL